jgi:type IV secretory pathway VirB4 component
MSLRFRMPAPFEAETTIISSLSTQNLVRFGIPIAAALIASSGAGLPGLLAALGVGAATGAALVFAKPYGYHFDQLVYHTVRWLSQRRSINDKTLDLTQSVSDPDIDRSNHCPLEDGSVTGVIEVEPTNIELMDEAQQGAVHQTYASLFETINYPVTVVTKQKPIDLTEYRDHIEDQEAPSNSIKEDYLRQVDNIASDDLATTNHYIVLRVTPDSTNWLKQQTSAFLDQLEADTSTLENWLPFNTDNQASQEEVLAGELDRRCEEVLDTVDSPALTTERVTGSDLDNLAREWENTEPAVTPRWTTTARSSGNEYRRTLYIKEYPRQLSFGWLIDLLRINGLVDITQTIEPQDPAKTTRKVNRLRQKVNAEIDSLLNSSWKATNPLERLLDDIDWLLDVLADRDSKPVKQGIYITVHGDTPEECRETLEQVTSRLRTMQIDYEEPVCRTDHGYKAQSPLHSDPLNKNQLLPGSSAAAAFPFGTQSIQQERGVLYGVDDSDGTPILLNRFNWRSHSMARMGTVGSGKSFHTKLELIRASLAYDDLQIIVVDPKNEYGRIVKRLGGQVYTLDNDYINDNAFDRDVIGFQVAQRGNSGNTELLTSLVERIYSITSQNSRKTLLVVDEARILLEDEDGREVLNQIVLEGRDVNTAATLVTQSARHFTDHRKGVGILDNMPAKTLFRHENVTDSMIDYFDLSKHEEQSLYRLKTGEESDYSQALMQVSGTLDAKLEINATAAEKALLNANEVEQ